jgi:hypothetical protein
MVEYALASTDYFEQTPTVRIGARNNHVCCHPIVFMSLPLFCWQQRQKERGQSLIIDLILLYSLLNVLSRSILSLVIAARRLTAE